MWAAVTYQDRVIHHVTPDGVWRAVVVETPPSSDSDGESLYKSHCHGDIPRRPRLVTHTMSGETSETTRCFHDDRPMKQRLDLPTHLNTLVSWTVLVRHVQ